MTDVKRSARTFRFEVELTASQVAAVELVARGLGLSVERFAELAIELAVRALK
jgi:hypothetical protein